jgi:hypothetical protein
MRPLSASECITPAIERTKSLLFRPFQWQAFLKLTAVAFFAEILGGGFSHSSPMRGKTSGVPTPAHGMIVALLLVVGLVVLLIGLVLLYFGSRLQLVLVEVVATGQTTIAPIWRRYGRLTWRWVGLKLLFFLVVGLILVAALAPVMISMFKNMPHDAGSPPPAAFFSHIALLLSAMFVGVLVFLTAYFLLRDLALPFLAFEDLSIAQTLSRLRSVILAAPGEVVLYLLFRFLLGLGAAIGAEIIILLVLLVSLIPFALIGGVLWLALHHAGSIGTAALIASAIVGGLVLLVWMACVFVGLLGTVFVFSQSYALYFLGGHYPLLGNFLEPPQVPNSTPPLSSTPPDSEGTPPLRNNPSPI